MPELRVFSLYDSLIRLAVTRRENAQDKALQCMRLIHFEERWKSPSSFTIEVEELLVAGGHAISFVVVDQFRRSQFLVYEDTDNVVRAAEEKSIGDAIDVLDPSSQREMSVPEGLGSGGCTAWALSKLHVFDSVDSATRGLNANIGSCPWSRENDTWHSQVVRRAVINRQYHMKKVDLRSEHLGTLLKKGDYLIDGVLNSSYVYLYGGFEIRQPTVPDDTTTPYSNEAAWRHSVAVSNGRILEKEFTMGAKWLWLRENNVPDRERGYMYKIFKVYRMYACNRPGQGCGGGCAAL